MISKRLRRIYYIITAIILVVATLIAGGVNSPSVYAAESTYSNVLDDLKKDSSFSEDNYPVNKGIISLSIISLAESTNNELFVYVYNAQADSAYNATYLRFFSTTASADYGLTLLSESESGTLQKYIVNGYTVSGETTRNYNITCIFRCWISGIDGEASDDETINHTTQVPFAVAKTYTFETLSDGSTGYSISITDVVTIQTKYLGYISYETAIEGVTCPSFDYTDSHFVAFSTDYKIDNLYEIDIVFTTRSVKHYTTGALLGNKNEYTYGDTSDPTYLTITSTQNVVTGADFEYFGFSISTSYLNARIEKADEFFANENNDGYKLEDNTTETISDCQYVVRYLETERETSITTLSRTDNYYQVNDMSILRLKFKSGDTTYNLGVVDNYQREGDKQASSGEVSGNNRVNNRGKWFIALLLLILLCVLLYPVLPYVVQAVAFVIKLPFKTIRNIIKAFKKKE